MAINNGEHTTRKHRLQQRYDNPSVVVDTTWWDRESHGTREIVSIITVDTGCAHLQIDISPTEARALAESLQQQADEVEAAQQQLKLEAEPA